MDTKLFSTRSSYLESIRGLLRLHKLSMIGQDVSPEADAIRDSLEGPWADLSDTEKRRITSLSEDLYSISSPPREPDPLDPGAKRELNEFADACQSSDWDRAWRFSGNAARASRRRSYPTVAEWFGAKRATVRLPTCFLRTQLN